MSQLNPDETKTDNPKEKPNDEDTEPKVSEDTDKSTKKPTEESSEEPLEEPTEDSSKDPEEQKPEQETKPTEDTKQADTDLPTEEVIEKKEEEKVSEKSAKEKKQKELKKPKESQEPKEPKAVKTDESGEQENPDFKYIVRVANTNIDGNLYIPIGLASIKGIGIRMGTAITDKLKIPRSKKIGDITDEEVERLIQIIENLNNELPGWMMNRRNDFDTGDNLHIISSDIQRSFRDDLNRLKKIRSYRGIRHEQGQKVRGQRTRANGRSGMTVGVIRKKVQQTQKKTDKKSK